MNSTDATAVVGQQDLEIKAKPLFALFVDDDRPTVAEALKGASHQSETVLNRLRILTGAESESFFDIRIQPAGPEKFWVFFTPAAGQAATVAPAEKERFLSAVAERLGLPGNLAMRMFMFDFDGLRDAELTARLGDEAARAVRSSIEGALSEASIDGQVGRLAAGSYGILGADNENKDGMVASVIDVAGKLGVSEAELGAKVESVALDAADTEPESLSGLLSHVCHKFYQTARNGADFGADRLSEVPAEVEQAVRLIDTALERGDIAVTAREVRQIDSGDVSLYLAHGALAFGDETVAAERLLVMADHPELCGRHDRVVAAAAVESLPDADMSVPVIVDIGLPTLESGEAARIAADMAVAGRTVGFRPHGLDMSAGRSRGVTQVYQLLKEGIPVWLVNFSTAIAKTKRLHGAYVEVSATFLRDISAQPDRNTLLSRLLKVWHDVEVRLVALNVDSKNLASFVSKLGIAYGVGVAADPAADAPQSSRDAKA